MPMRLLAVLALLAALPAIPAAATPRDEIRVTVRPILAGPTCDRRAVGACQEVARARAIQCDAFSDRLACADTVLSAQSACFRRTGCD